MILPRPFVSTTNEHIVLRNYGATETDNSLSEPITATPRPLRVSRSMTFAAQGNLEESAENLSCLENGSRANRAIPSSRRNLPLRSLSIGGISAWSNGYREIGNPDDSQLLIEPDEPPPPYEVGFQFIMEMTIYFSGCSQNVCSII